MPDASRLLHRALQRAGVDLVRYRPLRFPELRMQQLVRHLGIELVLDVGANDGSYALGLRSLGYEGRIVSFEPQIRAFETLARRASADPRWEACQFALGQGKDREVSLNLSANSSSSSVLPLHERHLAAAADSRYVARETVRLTSLDAMRDSLGSAVGRTCLKADVQGYELEVLAGADRTLADVQLVDVELSLVPLYDGAPEFSPVVEHLRRRGFRLADIVPVLLDPVDGSTLQVNGIFVRT